MKSQSKSKSAPKRVKRREKALEGGEDVKLTKAKPSKDEYSKAEKAKETRKPKGKKRENDEDEEIGGRALWSGSISFGLVNIPVRLISALQSSGITFHMLHDKDMARLQRRMINPKTGEEVPIERQEIGFQIEKDKYIVISDEEIASIDPKKSQTIEITQFVDYDDLDPLYIDTFYYLQPAKISKPYNLLAEAMEKNRKAAIAKVALHSHEYLVSVMPYKGILCLFVLHYQEDIVSPEGLMTEAEPKENDVKKFESIIDSKKGRFNAKELVDENQLAMAELIKKKVEKHREAVKAPKSESAKKAPRADLMAALEESLSKIKNAKK